MSPTIPNLYVEVLMILFGDRVVTEVIKLERARQGGFYSNMTVVFIKRKVGDRHARGDASRSPKNAKDC